MTVELKYRSHDARVTAFFLAQYLGKRKPTLRTERETARYLERAIKLLVAQAVADAAQKDLDAARSNQ